MLRFIFDSVSLVYMYMHILLYSRASAARGGLNPHFIFRYCGTIKDLTLKRSVSSEWTAFTCSIYWAWSVSFCFASSLPAKDPDASHHCTCTKMLSWLFLLFLLLRCIFHFVKRTSAFTADPAFYLSHPICILSDIWSLLSLVKKKKKSLLKEKK